MSVVGPEAFVPTAFDNFLLNWNLLWNNIQHAHGIYSALVLWNHATQVMLGSVSNITTQLFLVTGITCWNIPQYQTLVAYCCCDLCSLLIFLRWRWTSSEQENLPLTGADLHESDERLSAVACSTTVERCFRKTGSRETPDNKFRISIEGK